MSGSVSGAGERMGDVELTAEKDAGLRAALTRLADDWEKGLDVDGAHHMDPACRLVRDVRALLTPGGSDA